MDEEAGEEIKPSIVIEVGPAGRRSYALIIPLKVNGKWLRKVDLRLPSQGDIDDWGTGEIENARAFLCRLTGLDPLVIKALRWPDSEALYQMFRDVMPDFVASNGA